MWTAVNETVSCVLRTKTTLSWSNGYRFVLGTEENGGSIANLAVQRVSSCSARVPLEAVSRIMHALASVRGRGEVVRPWILRLAGVAAVRGHGVRRIAVFTRGVCRG